MADETFRDDKLSDGERGPRLGAESLFPVRYVGIVVAAHTDGTFGQGIAIDCTGPLVPAMEYE